MAIYHLSATTISRGKGQSATASASYRSGERLYSERYGESNFYAREVKPETFILKPEHAPNWCLKRENLWNEVEKIETSNSSRLAREFNISLPIELTKEEQLELTKEYVQTNFVDKGMVADVSIHRDDVDNPHFHVMLTTRPFNQDGTWGMKAKRIILTDENGNTLYYSNGDKKSRKDNFTDWNDNKTLLIWRKNWATLTNKYLENAGSAQRISEKSYAELGEEKIPTIHEGYVAREMDKRGKVSERVEQNKRIKKENYNKQKEYSNATINVIMNPLSPKEKGELKVIAKNLKVFVNYDNLIDKERMIKNWQRTEAINIIIKPEHFDSSVLDKIEFTKENIERGKEILEKQYLRIFEKHYPELIEHHFSKYAQMNIAKRSLEVDKVLEPEEVVSILSESRDNEVKDILKTISKNAHVKPSIEYNRAIVVATKKLDEFYKENNVTQDTVQNLSEDKKEEFKKLYKYQDLQLDTKELMSTYYNQTIISSYPTADLSELNFGEREELSKAITYYGNTLSYTKLVEASQEKFISKYTTYDQKIGLNFIKQLDNGTFTKEDRQALESDYYKKEIFDTVSNEATKALFLNEVAHNQDLSVDSSVEQGEGIGSSPSLLEKLAKNGNIYNNLLRASEDNARRKAENRNRKAPKVSQSVQIKNNKKAKEKTRMPSM